MGLENYKDAEVFTDDRFQLITKMYDKVILNLKYIIKYKEINKPTEVLDTQARENYNFLIENRTGKLQEIIDIIDILKSSLDFETEELKSSSEYLYGLYEYQLLNLYKITIDLDETILKSLLNVFSELREGWKDAVKELNK